MVKGKRARAACLADNVGALLVVLSNNLFVIEKVDVAIIHGSSQQFESVGHNRTALLVVERTGVMNIHPALLPSFGGQGMWGHHVHEAVLKAGCKISGCTVHFCTNEYDKGPIIVQRTCEVKYDDTPDTLASRVFEQECKAYPEAIKLFAEGRITVEGSITKIKP